MDLSVLNNHVTRIVCDRTTMFFVGWWFTGATNVDGCAFVVSGLVQLPLQHHHGSVCLTILSQVSNCRLLHFWTHLTTKAFNLWSTLKMKKTHAINPLDFSGRTLQKTYLASLFRKAILIHVLVHSQRITPMASACFRSTVQYSVRHKQQIFIFCKFWAPTINAIGWGTKMWRYKWDLCKLQERRKENKLKKLVMYTSNDEPMTIRTPRQTCKKAYTCTE